MSADFFVWIHAANPGGISIVRRKGSRNGQDHTATSAIARMPLTALGGSTGSHRRIESGRAIRSGPARKLKDIAASVEGMSVFTRAGPISLLFTTISRMSDS